LREESTEPLHGEIARRLGVSYNAAKNNLQRRAEGGVVKEDRFKGRKFWIAQDVLDVTTDEAAIST
jgi:transposase